MIIFVKFSSFFVDFCLLLCVLSICNGNFLFLFLDAPERWQFGFQDPATSIMEGIIDFHNHVMFFLILVVILVFYLLYSCLEDSNLNQIVDLPPAAEIDTRDIKDATNLNVGKWLEIVWTLFPSFILIMVALPSFALLYAIDAQPYTSPFSVKVIGHQWYWSYETTAAYIMENVDFVSNTSPFDMEFEFNTTIFEDGDLRATDDLLKSKIKGIRLLETNNRLILPVKTFLHFIITSSDVIHAWAVPSFGIKMDAIPGRLNQIDTFIKRTGTFYGQCSEICGINHGFMPICVGSVKPRYFAELMFGFYSGSLNDNVCFTENDKETWTSVEEKIKSLNTEEPLEPDFKTQQAQRLQEYNKVVERIKDDRFRLYHRDAYKYFRNWVGCPVTRYKNMKNWISSWNPFKKKPHN